MIDEKEEGITLREAIENGRDLEAMLLSPGGKRLLAIINEAETALKRDLFELDDQEQLVEKWEEARRWKLLGERLNNEIMIARDAQTEINKLNRVVGMQSGGNE